MTVVVIRTDEELDGEQVKKAVAQIPGDTEYRYIWSSCPEQFEDSIWDRAIEVGEMVNP